MSTNDTKKPYRFLKAEEITPKDDAFHGNSNLLDIEWWYFDAIFDNGYSVHVGFRTYHIRNSGILQERITIYKDGKKFTAFSHERVSTLEEISIYTDDEDISLKEVLKAIYDKLNGEAALSYKSNSAELKAFFEKVVPNYDKENVYVSDIKKVINWYNLLQERDLLSFEEEEKEEEKKEKRCRQSLC